MHWNAEWRKRLWENLEQPWDVVVIGGGITGAGILQAAAEAGARVLLIEQRDFAWGTSSRSSKLVHGGLRYLANGQIAVTYASVHERRRLLDEARDLVTPLSFLMPLKRGAWLKNLSYHLGLTLYDVLGGCRTPHERLSANATTWMMPHMQADISGAVRYHDAQTDDARLVLRVLREAAAAGGQALNYTKVTGLIQANDTVVGVRVSDVITGQEAEIRAHVVINATGAWADQVRAKLGAPARMRPLRGSHLVFSHWRLPVSQALALPHPSDGRPIFVLPWEGVTLVGTTDCDHPTDLDVEPQITPEEALYLLSGVRAYFPTLHLNQADVIATWSGVRPVIDTGAANPSAETRDHVVWNEHGLLTVTGGKLTTFRLIARDALQAVATRLPQLDFSLRPLFTQAPPLHGPFAKRLGRYGAEASAVIEAARADELTPIAGTETLWAELRWACRAEAVVHLDDLLLRRTRVGLLLPEGAEALLERVQAICSEELGWDQARWNAEVTAYRQCITDAYSLPSLAGVTEPTRPTEHRTRRLALGAVLGAVMVWSGWRWVRQSR